MEPITSEKRLTMQDAVKLPAVWIAFQSAPTYTPDDEPLDLLAAVLDAGRSSRLYRSLVYEQKIAREVEAFAYLNEKAGGFLLTAKVQPGSTVEQVEAALWLEVEKLRQTPPSAEEVEKVRNRAQMQLGRARSELGKRADEIQRAYTYTGNASLVNQQLDRYNAVTAADIHRVAQKYLMRERSVVLHVLPENKN
jgi:zinc protease